MAAAAREVLIDLAAERGKVDRDDARRSRTARVVGPGSRPSFDFGELTKGEALMRLVDERAPTTAAARLDRWPARPSPKVDGRAFVTGTHRYASDMKRPGMLFGKVLRPPSFEAHARDRADAGRRGDARRHRSSTTATSSASPRRPSRPPSTRLGCPSRPSGRRRAQPFCRGPVPIPEGPSRRPRAEAAVGGGRRAGLGAGRAAGGRPDGWRRRTRSPTSPTPRWSRGPPSRSGTTAS